MPGISARVPLPSIELYESDCDGVIDALEFLPDSAGAGRWRGSPGTRTIVTLRRPPSGELHLTAVVVPRDYGDGPVPAPAAIRVDSAGQTRVEAVLADWTLPSDATIILDAGGGLGWGSPHERPAERVAADVANGLVSIQAAHDDYGVVLDPVTYAVDRAATARLRHRNASARVEEETNHG
jgi:N-methylhydantoinase B